MSAAVTLTRAGVVAGVRVAAPLAVAAAVFAATLGVLGAARGVELSVLLLMSATVFAGASQVVAIELWASDLPVAQIVLATLALNSRHLLMGATLAPWLNALPLSRALVAGFLIVDESWALAAARIRAGEPDAGFLFGAGGCLYAGWISGTLAGRAFGGQLPDPGRFGLDFLGVAVFVGLLTLFRPGRRDVAPLAVAAAVAVLGKPLLPGAWSVLAGGIAGAALAAWRTDEAQEKPR